MDGLTTLGAADVRLRPFAVLRWWGRVPITQRW